MPARTKRILPGKARAIIRQELEGERRIELTDAERVHILSTLRHCQDCPSGFVAEELYDDDVDLLCQKLALPE